MIMVNITIVTDGENVPVSRPGTERSWGMKITVLGGSWFIRRRIIEELAVRDDRVVVGSSGPWMGGTKQRVRVNGSDQQGGMPS